jgi:hypothetical protein
MDKINFISGPVSVVILEGKIGKDKKKIVLFGDKHLRNEQNECGNIDAIPIKQYLIKLFQETNEELNFFLETREKQINMSNKLLYTDNYISQLVYFFRREKDNFRKVKFHFTDIRDNIPEMSHGFKFSNYANNLKYSRNINIDRINEMLLYINQVITSINIIIISLKINQKEFKGVINKTKNADTIKFMKNIEKIIFRINNKKVKNTIRKILKLILLEFNKNIITKPIKLLEKIKSEISNSKFKNTFRKTNKAISELVFTLNECSDYVVTLFAIITDLYTIRRLLDKNYINNAIVYTGHLHTMHLTNILVNNFGFKIKNKFLNNSIKKYYNLNLQKDYFKKYFTKYFNNPNDIEHQDVEQCIDITKFKKPLI